MERLTTDQNILVNKHMPRMVDGRLTYVPPPDMPIGYHNTVASSSKGVSYYVWCKTGVKETHSQWKALLWRVAARWV